MLARLYVRAQGRQMRDHTIPLPQYRQLLELDTIGEREARDTALLVRDRQAISPDLGNGGIDTAINLRLCPRTTRYSTR